MEAIILGNPYDIVLGAITPVDIPAYESEKAVIQLTDGYNPYLIGGTVTTGNSYWFRYSTGLLRPLTITDSIVIGGTSVIDTEKLRVVGKINSTSLQLGSTVVISSILDEDTMTSDSATAVPTQQSVKAYVDTQIGTCLQSGDNISLLTNNSGYITAETDPIFVASAAYNITSSYITNWNLAYGWGNHALVGYITTELDPVFTASAAYGITSTQVTHWDSAYGWGDHALVGYITTETDPIFTASAAYTITSTNITNWGTAYTNNHTHTNKVLLDSLISSGAGTQALFNDGTYKTVLTSTAGSTTQLIYNNAGSYAGSSSMVFDGTTTTISTLLTPLLEIGNSSTTLTKDSSGNLTFYDAVVASSYTLSALVGTATNFWTPSGNNIWYGYKVGIGGTGTFTETLEVTGNIAADNFKSQYLRYNSNANLLLGPAAGDQESGSNKLYIHNNDSTTPLIYGNFSTLDTTLGGHLIIRDDKKLKFGSLGTVNIYHALDSSDYSLYFQDGFNTTALSLSDLRSADYYVLVDSCSDYTAMTSITTANKNIWNKASYITITGDGTKYLSDNGVYNTISGTITVTDAILKWDTDHYRAYTTKSEAGGASSNGKFYTDATDYPTATTQLVYDGNYYATNLYSNKLSLIDTTTYITRDSSTNLTFADAITGTKTLAELVAVPTLSNNILEWYSTGSCYRPYTVTTVGCFDNSATTPVDVTNRLNYNGVFYTSKLVLASSTASATGISVTMTASGSFGMQVSVDGGIGIYTQATSGTGLQGSTTSGQAGVYGVSQNAASAGVLGMSNNGYGLEGLTYFGTAAYLKAYGILTSNNSSSTFIIDRVHTGGVYNITGDMMVVTDNPTTSGTISGSLFKGIIGSTIRVNMNPRVVDSSTTVAYSFDTHNSLSTTGSKLASYRNNGAEKVSIEYDGSINIVTGASFKINDVPITGGVTPTNNILEWDATNLYYVPYTVSTEGCFDSSYTIPTGTTRLNYGGYIYATLLYGRTVYGVSDSGYGIYGNALSGEPGRFQQTGTPTSNITSSVVNIIRQHTTGTSYNITGNIINIIDNPATTGTISGKILSATLGTTERISLNPRVADSSSAVAYLFDTHNSLSTTGSKIISVKNNGTEKVSVNKDGVIEITAVGQGIILASPDGTRYKITVANGGTLAITAV